MSISTAMACDGRTLAELAPQMSPLVPTLPHVIPQSRGSLARSALASALLTIRTAPLKGPQMTVAIETILADLVAFPSLPGTANAAVVDRVRAELARHGVESAVLPGPEGDRSNLFATIGPRDRPGYILSGHMDVVPVDGQVWATDPFHLSPDGERLAGRGTTDMKGFLACVLAMVPEFLATPIERPVHIAFSYDEEIGCRGAPHLIERLPSLCARPAGCIVGEPSGMRPVLSHKGKAALELVIEGRAGHSSNPALGENALYPAAELLIFVRDLAARLAAEGPFDARFEPPHSTIQAGVIRGGSAVNIIPDRATVEIEVRSVPGLAPDAVTAEVVAELAALAERAKGEGRRLRVSHRELASYPALPPPDDRTLVDLMERLTGQAAAASVSYGTEAGLFHAAGIPAIVCGPGAIDRAHRANEYILRSELEACRSMLRGLGAALSGERAPAIEKAVP
jgi:acetylornithine deacetylase